MVTLLASIAAGEESEPSWLRAESTGVIDAPFEEVRRVLLDLEGFGRWFPTVVEWRVLARDDREARVYGRQGFPWPVADRDYVARYRWRSTGDALALEARGIAVDEPAPEARVVRLDAFRSEWQAAPAGTGATRVSYAAEGPVDSWLVRTLAGLAWQGETARVVDALRGEVARRASAPGRAPGHDAPSAGQKKGDGID